MPTSPSMQLPESSTASSKRLILLLQPVQLAKSPIEMGVPRLVSHVHKGQSTLKSLLRRRTPFEACGPISCGRRTPKMVRWL
ncbi:unnamed protein product [Protopolystoma xenopodis]|uniref:Uncharacterized protein n=1 Tax=Protopolystoma xenopodis TaxID=117903 RepID=A0A448XKL2_9PLAT|nr:unnamed protein product [Protopolystoma xenopodis]